MVHGWEVKLMSMLLLSPMPSLDNKIKCLLIKNVCSPFFPCKFDRLDSFLNT